MQDSLVEMGSFGESGVLMKLIVYLCIKTIQCWQFWENVDTIYTVNVRK